MKKLFLMLAGLWVSTAFSQLFQMPVYAVTSLQPAEGGAEVARAIDNDITTTYHSQWGQSGIPDELHFFFTPQVSSIKKMVYTPRQSGLNGVWTSVSVYYSTQTQPDNYILIEDDLSWAANNADKEIELTEAIQNPYAIKIEVHTAYADLSSCAEMRFYSETEATFEDGVDCSITTSSLSINGADDVQATINPTGTTASSFQPGENINDSYDGDVNTIYHSSWNNTVFPVLLNYRLDGITPIDYLHYIPRADGGDNGNFGNVTISYNTLGNASYQNLMSFDFAQSGIPTSVYFPFQITPLNIQISVQDGDDGFASCAEMEFYTSASSASSLPYTNVFTDVLYAALHPSIGQAQVDTISSPFYQALAQCLLDGTYNLDYRLQAYEVYPTVASVSSSLKVGGYDRYENATGIAFEEGERVALFAQNIPSSATVSLTVKDFSTELGGAVSYYPLHNGLNVFDVTNSGLGYISYYNNNAMLNDVDIHIASGKVNGYFKTDNPSVTNWVEHLTNTVYPMIDIVGEFAHLVYEKAALSNGSPFDPVPLINKYDTINRHERMLMGLFKYDISPKNRILSYGNQGGGWYAGGSGINLDLDWGPESVVDPAQLGIWGIAHEFGHVNQIRPNLRWIGTTEVTNNIYSVWVDYHMNNDNSPYSRLEAEELEPAPGMDEIEGGRINGAIFNTHINGEALQANTDYDVFKVLVPFWQLELYYQLAGASRNAPVLSFDYPQDYTGIDYAHWFGMVAEIARNTDASSLSNGERLLDFVKNTCDVVEEDLTSFFQSTGFLKPIDVEIDDYGVGQLTITQQQVDETIAYIEGKNYDAPVSPVIHYISAHSIAMFKQQLPLSGQTGVGATLNDDYLTVEHSEWHNAVAYETEDATGQVIYASISGTGDLTNQTTEVYYPSNAAAVYAIGFDGQRILVYPLVSINIEESMTESGLTVYPNPIGANRAIHLVVKNASANYDLNVVAMDGRIVLESNGSITAIENAINQQLRSLAQGTYTLHLSTKEGKSYRVRIVN